MAAAAMIGAAVGSLVTAAVCRMKQDGPIPRANDPAAKPVAAPREASNLSMTAEATAASEHDYVCVTKTQLDFNDVIQKVVDSRAGGIAVFIGTTRDNFDGKEVVELEYEAYESMAVKELRKVCSKMRANWTTNGGIIKCAIVHRVGLCPVKEASVIVACSSAHRLEALEAASFGIDHLKATVPIWKKEKYGEGSAPAWKKNKEFKLNAVRTHS